jgi:uncharacterized hydrophobic protein (TIGR00341 family)
MSGKIFEIKCRTGYIVTARALTESQDIEFLSESVDPENNQYSTLRLFVQQRAVQTTLDRLQSILPSESDSLILMCPVDVFLEPGHHEVEETGEQDISTREELFKQIKNASKCDLEFIVFALLATIVATIGIAENNSAVVIGAMVIAPLLGPNLGLALGSALGDKELIRLALITNAIGLFLTMAVAYGLALIWPPNTGSHELLLRTIVGPSTAVLALASGAAAALSITSRAASVLVGVMVAVALLPPAVVLAMMSATNNWSLAANAGLLLIINVSAVNISAQLVFILKGVRPRTWLAKREAKETIWINIVVWILMLFACFTALGYLV